MLDHMRANDRVEFAVGEGQLFDPRCDIFDAIERRGVVDDEIDACIAPHALTALANALQQRAGSAAHIADR